MGETYSCTLPDCDKVFSRAYQLKKHIAVHETPDIVFHCTECDFITLQRKNLEIHFAIHTGEKRHECPDMVSSRAGQQRCDFRTNDPAALSRHRKKTHGYIPPPNRSRPKAAPASTRKIQQNKEEKTPRRRRGTRHVILSPRRKALGSPRKTKNPKGGSGKTSNLIPLLRVEDEDGNEMDVNRDEDLGYESNAVTLVGTDDETGLDTLYDPSLRSEWMESYEMSYTTFDMTGMEHQLEALSGDSPFDPVVLDGRTGREGCLCPEWMVEVGVEGWDGSVLEAHKEYYVTHV